MKTITKICTKCNNEKVSSEFYKDSSLKHGIKNICKVCTEDTRKAHNRTKEGLISKIYTTQVGNSKQRSHKAPDYTREELKKMVTLKR